MNYKLTKKHIQMCLSLIEIRFPTGRDSATFRDKGTEVPSLFRDKGTTGQDGNLTICPVPIKRPPVLIAGMGLQCNLNKDENILKKVLFQDFLLCLLKLVKNRSLTEY